MGINPACELAKLAARLESKQDVPAAIRVDPAADSAGLEQAGIHFHDESGGIGVRLQRKKRWRRTDFRKLTNEEFQQRNVLTRPIQPGDVQENEDEEPTAA